MTFEPGTPAYYNDNQNKLALFLFALALGRKKASNGIGQTIPAHVWQNPNAALLIIVGPDDDQSLVQSLFGSVATQPMSIEMGQDFTHDRVSDELKLTQSEIDTLRDYYHIREAKIPVWKEAAATLRYKQLLRRMRRRDKSRSHA